MLFSFPASLSLLQASRPCAYTGTFDHERWTFFDVELRVYVKTTKKNKRMGGNLFIVWIHNPLPQINAKRLRWRERGRRRVRLKSQRRAPVVVVAAVDMSKSGRDLSPQFLLKGIPCLTATFQTSIVVPESIKVEPRVNTDSDMLLNQKYPDKPPTTWSRVLPCWAASR